MSGPLVMQGVISALEQGVNAYLRLDPDTLTRLAELNGKVIAVEISSLDQVLYLHPVLSGINISTQHAMPDVQLRGTPWALLRLMLHKGNEAQALVTRGEVEITGELELARVFKAILDSIDIDWEELFSKVLGDVPAHKLANAVRNTQAWGARTAASLTENFAEYQQEESRNLPGQAEVQEFLQAVDEMRDDVERVAQRIQRLQETIKTKQEHGG